MSPTTTEADTSETTVKKSVTIRRSIAEQIEERVGTAGFSSFVDTAAEHRLAFLKAQEAAAPHQRGGGPNTDEDPRASQG